MSAYIFYLELAAFAASCLAWPVIRKAKHLRIFPLLLFVIVVVEPYQTFAPDAVKFANSAIYNVQVPLQHLLFLYILFLSMEHKTYRRILLAAAGFLVPFTVVTGIFFTEENHFNVLAYCVGSVLIVMGILLKFYEMLQNPEGFNFLRNPFFYILFAFLLFNVGTLPYFTMSNWLYYIQDQKSVRLILINVMSVFNYILYGTYTIVFVWMMLKKESS